MSSSGAAKLPGYLNVANNGAMFLQWQRNGDYVHGTMSESYYDQSAPTQLKADSGSYTGSITGNQVSITFDGGVTWSGVLSGSTLTLSYTDNNGALQTLDFHPGNAAQYNAAVAATKATVSGAQTQAQRRRDIANAQRQVDSDVSSLTYDLQSLQSATSELAGDTYGSDLASIEGDVQTVSGDLATVRSDSSDVACSDAGVASSDAAVAASDESVLHNDAQVYANDVSQLRGQIAAVGADQRKLAADNAAVPGYGAANTPSSTEISAAFAAAHRAIAMLHTRTEAAETRAAQLVAQANALAKQAQQAGCR